MAFGRNSGIPEHSQIFAHHLFYVEELQSSAMSSDSPITVLYPSEEPPAGHSQLALQGTSPEPLPEPDPHSCSAFNGKSSDKDQEWFCQISSSLGQGLCWVPVGRRAGGEQPLSPPSSPPALRSMLMPHRDMTRLLERQEATNLIVHSI